jgi:hypothetical protein
VFVAAGMLLSGCVSSSRTARDYELKAGNSAKAVASSVATATLGARTAAKHQATGPYLSVLLGRGETDAESVQSTFDSVQPPDASADQLRKDLDGLLSSAIDGLSAMRITVRRGELGRLPHQADLLAATLKQLRAVADRYQ